MRALKTMPISFPGLFGDWEFNPDPVALDIGHGVYWYGIILAIGMLAGLYLALKQAKRFGIKEDDVTDVTLWAIPSCIVGARTYYVLFYLDLYRRADGSLDVPAMFRLWDGGLAIYGAVIAGALVLFLFARAKKIPVAALMDLGVMGLILGQIIGRWANFINREAFGGLTDLPWRMRLWTSATEAIEVHPTFFYESMWNLVGLLLMLFVVTKARRFDGENTCFYLLWYGAGRFWIEGLRTDSLYLFDWTFLGEPIRVSQALSAVIALVAAGMLFYNIGIKKCTADGLWVNRLAAMEAAEEPVEEADAASEESAAAEPDVKNDTEEADNGDQN
ncbi:MAG: prolipoprotein diacylglyceryl transferase [Oscillibacter sp.]|nr:prolipoprotein diacylglyceryl transferase [Oscillibacter sp.]